MATVINNPRGEGEGSGVGMIIGVLVAILLIVLFFVYALPAIRNTPAQDNGGINVDVDLPGGGGDTFAPSGGTPSY